MLAIAVPTSHRRLRIAARVAEIDDDGQGATESGAKSFFEDVEGLTLRGVFGSIAIIRHPQNASKQSGSAIRAMIAMPPRRNIQGQVVTVVANLADQVVEAGTSPVEAFMRGS